MDGSVTVSMAAPADTIWELIADVRNTGKFSPEVMEAEWLDGATGPALGVKFRGHVKRNGIGPTYWTTCTVVESEPGREFAFGVGNGDTPLNVWRYRLKPVGATTDVTESFELVDNFGMRLYWLVLGWARGKRNANDMRTTLERVKAVVEAERS